MATETHTKAITTTKSSNLR